MSWVEPVNTVVYICAPLIFFTSQNGTEKAVRQRLNSSMHVHALVLQNLWMSLWELKPITSMNDIVVQMIIVEPFSPVIALQAITLYPSYIFFFGMRTRYGFSFRGMKGPVIQSTCLCHTGLRALLVLSCMSYLSNAIWSVWHNTSQDHQCCYSLQWNTQCQ